MNNEVNPTIEFIDLMDKLFDTFNSRFEQDKLKITQLIPASVVESPWITFTRKSATFDCQGLHANQINHFDDSTISTKKFATRRRAPEFFALDSNFIWYLTLIPDEGKRQVSEKIVKISKTTAVTINCIVRKSSSNMLWWNNMPNYISSNSDDIKKKNSGTQDSELRSAVYTNLMNDPKLFGRAWPAAENVGWQKRQS
ncbi:uncharacterized protein LOC134217298 [Armigeres subalbatus]|uniref:uncharacterized protein LOC134217298 n=1 Tax=Armigeres subalbatus TaxID=124917 RepID=UPI002ED288E7